MGHHTAHHHTAPPDPASVAAFAGLRPYKTILPAFQAASVVLTFVGPFIAPNLWLPFVSLFLCAFLAASALQVRRMVAFVLALGVAVLAALVAVPWDGDVVTAPLVRDARATAAGAPLDTAAYTRRTVTFPLLGGE